MFKKVITGLLLICSFSAVNACKNPDNVFSLMFKFDSDYSVNLSLFEVIGDENVNFFRKNDSNEDITMSGFNDIYSYTSHYNNRVMVEIASVGMNFIIDTSRVDTDSFYATSCISTELDWLNLVGIIQISKENREKIASAFKDSFKSMVYWTKWDTLLSSDMDADSSGIFSMVRCFSEFSTVFPPEQLEHTSGIIKKNDRKKHNYHINEKNNSSVMIDIRGRKIQSANSLKTSKISTNVIIQYDPQTGKGVPQIRINK